MTEQRESEIARAFVALTSTLIGDLDSVSLFSELTRDCARLLDINAAGLLLADRRGTLHVVAASSEQARTLELFQLQRQEGPCLDCFSSGERVNVPDLQAERERWPLFVGAADRGGFRSLHALPMRLRGRTLGALGLFGSQTGSISDGDLELAQALTHVAAVALVTEAATADQIALNTQLQNALDTRVVIEQAKGLLAQLGDLDMEQAFSALRQYARNNNQRLGVAAKRVVEREVDLQQVLDGARGAR